MAVTAARGTTPTWSVVEDVIEDLAKSHAPFPTTLAADTTIASYERERRLMIVSSLGSQWLAIDSIRECWETFERLGRIRKQDVLEPGRSSAFMFALFLQVPGVVQEGKDGEFLAFADTPAEA